ncbi:MAG: hypothetical protein M0036_12740 [Desulfobacteraceae bacterium]|nr:hypothetical protein [Desulfobacteraceae bacterium]
MDLLVPRFRGDDDNDRFTTSYDFIKSGALQGASRIYPLRW